ncbi:MAG: hypothetical protein K8953_08010, partial [Proteobacteria bacterium]|nr:hypothetical protein [Pseudomonadota bacterium]
GLFDVPAGFEAKCKDNDVVENLICASSGKYANPFDTGICTGNRDAVQEAVYDNCQANIGTGTSTNTGPSEGANCDKYFEVCAALNPFNTAARPALCPPASDAERAVACSKRNIRTGTLGTNCSENGAVTALVCTDKGKLANPFDTGICTGDQTTAQSTYIDNCRVDAERLRTSKTTASSPVADGADCSTYTACAANPFRGAVKDGAPGLCNAAYYEPERHAYTVNLLEYCSGRASATAPAGFTDVATDCRTEQIRSAVCVSSGEYANPLDAEICNESDVADIATIQAEFLTACYNTRNDAITPTGCGNINACFENNNLHTGSVFAGRTNCATSVALNDIRALDLCQGQTSGGDLTGTSCVQATLTKACTANPFSEVANGKGVGCLSDTTTVVSTDSKDRTTTLDDVREQFCINDSTKYDCTAFGII